MLYNPNLKFTVMLLFQLKKNEHLNILNIKDLKILSVHKEVGGGVKTAEKCILNSLFFIFLFFHFSFFILLFLSLYTYFFHFYKCNVLLCIISLWGKRNVAFLRLREIHFIFHLNHSDLTFEVGISFLRKKKSLKPNFQNLQVLKKKF